MVCGLWQPDVKVKVNFVFPQFFYIYQSDQSIAIMLIYSVGHFNKHLNMV